MTTQFKAKGDGKMLAVAALMLVAAAITALGTIFAFYAALNGVSFSVLSAKIPGVIVETAFISNSVESKLLTEDDFRERLASAICNGIIDYLVRQNQVIMK